MNVGITITCMTCLFAVALTMGGPIRRQTSQSEKTVPIRGNVTFLCPFVPDVTWQYVYWKKNNYTIYSLEVQSNTPSTYDTRYEGSNHATRFTIKDLKKTDSGIYYCKVATLATADFIKEGGQVLLSVTDQEGGLFTTSPGFPLRTSTSMPPKHPEDNTFYLAFSITLSILIIIIIIITMGLVVKYRKQIAESRFVKACRGLQGSKANISDQAGIPLRAPDNTTPTRSDVSAPRDQNSPSSPLLERSAQQGSQANIRDQADIPLRAPDSTTSNRSDVSAPRDPNSSSSPLLYNSAQLEQGSPAIISDQADIPLRAPDTTSSRLDASAPRDLNVRSTPLPHSSTQTSERGETQLPLVGPVLIDDLCRVSASKRKSIEKRMTLVLHYLVKKNRDEGVPPKGGKYSASLRKYASSRNRCVPNRVLEYVEYFLDELDNIPVGCKRDVCEILLTMPQNQEVVASTMDFLNKDTDDQVRAASHINSSRTPILREQMRNILGDSKTRDAARCDISLIILDASPVKTSGSGSFSQQTASRYYQPANETGEETGVQSQSDADLKHEEENLIEFWLSKVIQLDPAVQRTVSDRFAAFDHDADSSSKLQGSQTKICVQADNSLRASDTSIYLLRSCSDASDPCDPFFLSTPLPLLHSSAQLQQGSQAKICVQADNSLGASYTCIEDLLRSWSDASDRYDLDSYSPLHHSSAEEKTMDQPDMIDDNAKELKNNFNECTDQDKAMGRRNMPNTDAKEERNITLDDNIILVPQSSKASWPQAPALDLNSLTKEQLITLINDSYAPTSNDQVSAKPGRLKDEIKGPMIKQIYAKDEEKAIAGPDMQNHDVKELMNTNLKKSTELNKKSIEIPGEKEKG